MMDFRALEALNRQDYLSPLVSATPDLRRHFQHIWGRRQPTSFGHIVYSDWAEMEPEHDSAHYREIGFWTRDEAAILYHCAKQFKGKLWLDIGACTGWTVAHAAEAGALVIAIDPLLKYAIFRDRFEENTAKWYPTFHSVWLNASLDVFKNLTVGIHGAVIDGDHNWHEPLIDAQHAAEFLRLEKRGVILFHDFIGGPVREGVEFLITHGWKCRVYFTPHMVACCWRGKFTPPEHVPDPAIASMLRERCPDFDFERCV